MRHIDYATLEEPQRLAISQRAAICIETSRPADWRYEYRLLELKLIEQTHINSAVSVAIQQNRTLLAQHTRKRREYPARTGGLDNQLGTPAASPFTYHFREVLRGRIDYFGAKARSQLTLTPIRLTDKQQPVKPEDATQILRKQEPGGP